MKKKHFLLVISVLFLPTLIQGKNDQKVFQNEKTNRGIYIELFGASNLIGLSYDSRLNPTSNWGYRVGISYYKNGNSKLTGSNSNSAIFSPLEINYLLGKKKSKLELGVGTSLGLYKENTSFAGSQKIFGYYLFSNIGYRYQAKKGLLFRTGISPSFSFKGKHGLEKNTFFTHILV